MRYAFTLIELLAVIAIIALIAGILFPVFSQARKKSYQTTCLSNLRQIGTATLMYAQDYDDMLLWAGDPGDVNGAWAGSPDESLFKDMKPQHEVLYPYTKNKSIWKCPADTGTYAENNLGFTVPQEAKPTSFDKFGTSYYTRTSILLKKKPISTLEAFIPDRVLGGTSSIGYYFDATGTWHGGSRTDIAVARWNVAYLDGHSKSVDATECQKCWMLQVR